MGFVMKADLETIYNGPLWFLPCLFYVQVFGYLILKIENDLTQMLIVIILSVSGILLPVASPIGLGGALIALSFWFIGYQVKRQNLLQEISLSGRLMHIMAALCLLLIVGLMKSIGGNISMSDVTISNYVWFLIGGTAGSIAIVISAMAIGKSRWVEFIGANAIIIFGFHSLVQKAIDITRIFTGIDFYSLFGREVYFFIIVWNLLFCSIAVLLLNKTNLMKSLFLRRH
jgi:hypothetical protein